MYVDEKRSGESQVTGDPFDPRSLIAWLERQPADKTYLYREPRGCALCQYFSEMGFLRPYLTMYALCAAQPDSPRHIVKSLPDGFDATVRGRGTPGDWTFGKALDRARVIW